jgi:hypothetical protein
MFQVRELSGSTTVRTRTVSVVLNGAWQQLTATTAAAGAGHALDLVVTGQSLSAGQQLLVDDVSLL